MKCIAYIAQSLDGYIARPDGDIAWLDEIDHHDQDGDYGWADFISTVDCIAMGRHSYEKVLSFGEWPYALPVYVLSSHTAYRAEPPEDKNPGAASFLSGSPKEILEQLQNRVHSSVYIDGGQTICRFIDAALLNEMIISTVPVLLGSGIPLFGKLRTGAQLSLRQSVEYKSGLVKSHYTVDYQ